MPSAVAPIEAARLLSAAGDQLEASLIGKLSAPFVLARTPATKKTLLVFGQETAGWGGADWTDAEGALSHWLSLGSATAVQALAERYADFYREPSVSSPFWMAQNAIAERLGAEWTIIWSNLMRVDTSPWSKRRGWRSCSAWWNLSYAEVDAICRWQTELQQAELATLRPDAVLFLTGPHYDYCIRQTFGALDMSPILDMDVRVAARLKVTGMPCATFRTYHPNYLRRSGQWQVLTALINAMDSS